jgi:hypothetical protein
VWTAMDEDRLKQMVCDDLSDIIYQITPTNTPFITQLKIANFEGRHWAKDRLYHVDTIKFA